MENDHPLLMNAHHHTHQSDINHLPLKWPPQSCHVTHLTKPEHPYGAKFFQGTHDLKTPENPERKTGVYPLKPQDSSTQMEAFVFGIPYKSKKRHVRILGW